MITSSSTATTIIIGCMEHFLCTRHCGKEIHAHSGDVGQPYDLPGPTERNRSDAVQFQVQPQEAALWTSCCFVNKPELTCWRRRPGREGMIAPGQPTAYSCSTDHRSLTRREAGTIIIPILQMRK